MPPQLLLGQARVETTLNPERFRYEPVTIDFVDIGGDAATRRNDTYILRHILAGSAVNAATQPRCAVILGPGVNLTPQQIGDCTPIQGANAHVAPGVLLADAATTRIQGRVGRPGVQVGGQCQYRPGYRNAPINVTRNFTAPPVPAPLPLVRVEQPYFSDLSGPQRIQVRAGQYQVNFLTNTFRLGAPLQQGEWLTVAYQALQPDPVSTAANTCSQMPPVSFLNGRTQEPNRRHFTFLPGDTISAWVTRNALDQNPGHPEGALGWFNGTCSERCLEYPLDDSGRRNPVLLDRRFELATAQFWAAGSFGMWQATLKDWDQGSHKDVILNKVFDIGGTSPENCLPELFTQRLLWRVREGAALASASHSFWLPQYPRNCTQCDQVDWARRWSNIIRRYNLGGNGYPASGQVEAVTRGVEDYDAR